MKKSILLMCIWIACSFSIQASTPYIIIVSLDGFRWDYCERNITPNIQHLIDEGVKAKSMEPCFPSKTFPNHISIMTGMYPAHHGIILNSFEDPINHESYSMNKGTKSKWYKSPFFWEMARKYNIVTASYFWPGSNIDDAMRRPNYAEPYNHFTPYLQVLDTLQYWLSLPYNKRPHFITAYFHEADDAGHQYGPNAPQTIQAIKKVDTIIGALSRMIKNSILKDSVNIIIVSDHGMTSLDTAKYIAITDYIKNEKYTIQYDPVICFFNSQSKEDVKKIYKALQQHENHFKVYLKKDIPLRFHYNNNIAIGDIVAIADLGYSFVTNKADTKKIKGGNHGYDNEQKDMHATFIAEGYLFKKNYKIGTISNLAIYPLLCRIFNIPIPNDIDGSLSPSVLSILK